MTHQVNQYDSRGRLHGVWEGYQKDGTLQWREMYFHGTPRGLWEYYWPNGTPQRKCYCLVIK
jgi:antitoxin component YwqK of YwqJK toxin-antitoxin module